MTSNSEFINSLVKIAEQMIDNADAPQKGSPEEVLSGIQSIIEQLEQVASTIPAQPEQPAAPVATSEPTQSPAQSAKIAELEKTVKRLNDTLEAKQREEIAEEIASFYSDSRKAQQARDEVLNSKESIDVLQAKLETIAKYADTNGVTPARVAKSETFNYVRTAQLSGERLHNL